MSIRYIISHKNNCALQRKFRYAMLPEKKQNLLPIIVQIGCIVYKSRLHFRNLTLPCPNMGLSWATDVLYIFCTNIAPF